jgi:hypothetical protein
VFRMAPVLIGTSSCRACDVVIALSNAPSTSVDSVNTALVLFLQAYKHIQVFSKAITIPLNDGATSLLHVPRTQQIANLLTKTPTPVELPKFRHIPLALMFIMCTAKGACVACARHQPSH